MHFLLLFAYYRENYWEKCKKTPLLKDENKLIFSQRN